MPSSTKESHVFGYSTAFAALEKGRSRCPSRENQPDCRDRLNRRIYPKNRNHPNRRRYPKRCAARSRALAASISRLRAGAPVTSESTSRRAICVTSSTA
jgi:hypothetical protein